MTLAPGSAAVVGVAVATLWTDPSAPRPGIDDPAIAAPADPDAWNARLCDDATRGALLPVLETQATYGTVVLVDEVRGGWARVVVPSQTTTRDERGYPGWVPARQLVDDAAFVRTAAACPEALVVAHIATLRPARGARAPERVAFTTRLPVVGSDRGGVRVALPGGGEGLLPGEDVEVREAGVARPAVTPEQVLATARRFEGLQYLWAGMTGWGFDCSGFVHAVLARHGVAVPRDAGDQLRASGLPAVERADLRPGDLVFFSSEPGAESIRHVAFVAGEDRILHSPNFRRTIAEESLRAYDVRDEYAGAVRPIAT